MIPQLRVWHERYEGTGLTIVGVHTPEFTYERSYENVVEAARTLHLRYPIVQDNSHEIWKRFGVWAWPTTILVDKKGLVRYRHIGEGAYGETEAMIRRLLDEKG